MLKNPTYKKPFIFALLLHLTLFTFFAIKFSQHHHYLLNGKPNTVKIVHAVVVSQQQIAALKRAQEQKKLAHLRYLQKLHQLAVARKKRKLEKLHLAKIRAEKIARAKELAIKRKQLAALHRAHELALHQKILQQKKLAALKAKQQREHKLQLQRRAKQHAAMVHAMQQQIANEAKQMAAAQARVEQSVMDRYKALIVHAIAQRWIVPRNLAQGVSCQLLINLAPGGTVLAVKVLQSSGDPLLDRSATTAVLKAAPLPVPNNPQLFNYFRQLRLTVRPTVAG